MLIWDPFAEEDLMFITATYEVILIQVSCTNSAYCEIIHCNSEFH